MSRPGHRMQGTSSDEGRTLPLGIIMGTMAMPLP